MSESEKVTADACEIIPGKSDDLGKPDDNEFFHENFDEITGHVSSKILSGNETETDEPNPLDSSTSASLTGLEEQSSNYLDSSEGDVCASQRTPFETVSQDVAQAHWLSKKKNQLLKHQYLSLGHGAYGKVSWKRFFKVTQHSPRVVVHCFEKSCRAKSEIIDIHLKRMSKDHLETKFIKLDFSVMPELNAMFGPVTAPSLLVYLKNELKTVITDLYDVFYDKVYCYKLLEWKLAHFKAIHYSKSLGRPPYISRNIERIRYDYPAAYSSDSDYSTCS